MLGDLENQGEVIKTMINLKCSPRAHGPKNKNKPTGGGRRDLNPGSLGLAFVVWIPSRASGVVEPTYPSQARLRPPSRSWFRGGI